MSVSTRTKSLTILGAVLAFFLLSAESCEDSPPSAEDNARTARSQSIEGIRENQPVNPMNYSPTIETINGWTRVWSDKTAVSYVYMKRADGTFDGYYVLKGLPVNYCVSGSPTAAIRTV